MEKTKIKKEYIITLDEGTTSARTVIVNRAGEIVATSQIQITQMYPQSGWVEHNATEILNTQLATMVSAKRQLGLKSNAFAAMGITNQRETIVVWNKETGLPVYNAIVWQDRRTSEYCDSISTADNIKMIQEKTGLIINPYFSATKLKWILENVPEVPKLIEQGKILAGTIDTWLMWNLTNGAVFSTDVTNASRTLLFNIHTQQWDDDLLKLFKIPRSILPEVKSSGTLFGYVDPKFFSKKATGIVPITGVLGDQQSSLFGHMCTDVAEVKNTYGTGCFTLMNTGLKPVLSKNNLLTTIGWKIGDEPTVYALEGSVFIGGSVLQWLRDELQILYQASEADFYASLVLPNSEQKIYVVPSFTGLGAPYWDSYSRGAIFGLERGTKREHIIRAALESIAFQTNDLITSMAKDLKRDITSIKVDGGAAQSNYLMKFQASISETKVIRPVNIETTALGATYMAGLAIKFWPSIAEIKKLIAVEKVFEPEMLESVRNRKIHGWKEAVSRTRDWTKKVY